MVKKEVLLRNSKDTVPVYTHLTAESCEFAQRDDEIVKHITEAIVGRDHGTFPVMSHPRNRVTGRPGSPSKSLRRLAWILPQSDPRRNLLLLSLFKTELPQASAFPPKTQEEPHSKKIRVGVRETRRQLCYLREVGRGLDQGQSWAT